MRADVNRSDLGNRASVALWYALLGAPFAWFLELCLSYPVVPYACYSGNVWTLYVMQAAALLLALGAGAVGYSLLMDAGAELPADHATRTDRSRLLASVGMMSSGLFSLILVGHLISTAVIGPCIPLPRERFTPDTFVAPESQPWLADAEVHR